MFKLAVALVVLVGLAVADDIDWEKIPSAGNHSQCVYRSEIRMLGCRGLTGVVECGVLGTLPQGFEVFGLGRETVEGVLPVESTRYWLYPRELNETTYLNHVVEVQNVTHNVSLFHLESFNETFGLRVPDVKCWTRLVDLFNASVGTQVVRVEEMSTEVPLFGEVLVLDRQTKKRFLGFGLGLGGLGLGLGGFGFGGLGFGWGLGWGLPLGLPLFG